MNQDRQWIEALMRHGDEAAFRCLYRRHTPRLHQIALRLLGPAASEAEDVVQEVWLRAVTKLADFRWESAFATWLTGIGLNLCRERLRRRGRSQLKECEWPEGLEPVAEGSSHSARLDLEQALTLLPDGYRAAVVLHDVEGHTHREIAHWLGVSEGTSKSQLFNARRILRSRLGGKEEISHESRKRGVGVD